MLEIVRTGSQADINFRARQGRFDCESGNAQQSANNPMTSVQRCSCSSERDSNL